MTWQRLSFLSSLCSSVQGGLEHCANPDRQASSPVPLWMLGLCFTRHPRYQIALWLFFNSMVYSSLISPCCRSHPPPPTHRLLLTLSSSGAFCLLERVWVSGVTPDAAVPLSLRQLHFLLLCSCRIL